MKRMIAISLLTAALQTVCMAQQKSALAVLISTPTPVLTSGQQIRLDVSVTNTSDQAVRILKALGSDGHAEAVNRVEVYDSDGNKLSRTDGPAVQINGQTHHLLKRGMSRKTVPLEPGKSDKNFLILSHLFNMSKPEKYTVMVRQERMDLDQPRPQDRFSFVSSNTITIMVTD